MKITENKLRKIIREELAKLNEGIEVYQVRLGFDKRESDWDRKFDEYVKYLERNNVSYDTQTFSKVRNLHATFENRRDAEEFEQRAESDGIYSEFETLRV